MIKFWQGLHTVCHHCASNMDDGWCHTRMYGPCLICAMKDHIRHLRMRTIDLSLLERKLGDLKNQVRQLEGHLEQERQEKQTLYYKKRGIARMLGHTTMSSDNEVIHRAYGYVFLKSVEGSCNI